MAELNDLYRYAAYYEIVFGREVDSEIDFLIELARKHSGRPPRRVVELGCGPGYHARAFARHGLAAVGLDWSDEMIRFATNEAAREGIAVDWRVGDMRAFALSEPVDLAVCLFDSIDSLCSLDDFVGHFRVVAANLVANGLYVIGQSHQRDVSLIGYGPFHYEGERNGCRVRLDWATDAKIDTLSQTADVELVMRVFEAGEERVFRYRTTESCPTPLFLIAAARLSGALEAFDWYGGYRLDQPYDDSAGSTHCISVFRKRRPTDQALDETSRLTV
jgi:SAM-dependent methyltransferase